MKQNIKTEYIFPEKGAIGIIEVPTEVVHLQDLKFAMLELEISRFDEEKYSLIRDLLRQAKAATITHTPSLFEDDNSTNLIFSLHKERSSLDNLPEPLALFLINVDNLSDAGALKHFNDQIFHDGHLRIAITIPGQMTILTLMEIFAVAPPITDDDFEGLMSVFGVESKFFAEYLPSLDDPVDWILHAILNHRLRSSKLMHKSNAINLTGLIPDGLA